MPWSDDKGGSEYRDVYILQYRVDDEGWRTSQYYSKNKADFNRLISTIRRDMLSFGHKKVVFKLTKRKKIYWHGLSLPTNPKYIPEWLLGGRKK